MHISVQHFYHLLRVIIEELLAVGIQVFQPVAAFVFPVFYQIAYLVVRVGQVGGCTVSFFPVVEVCLPIEHVQHVVDIRKLNPAGVVGGVLVFVVDVYHLYIGFVSFLGLAREEHFGHGARQLDGFFNLELYFSCRIAGKCNVSLVVAIGNDARHYDVASFPIPIRFMVDGHQTAHDVVSRGTLAGIEHPVLGAEGADVCLLQVGTHVEALGAGAACQVESQFIATFVFVRF